MRAEQEVWRKERLTVKINKLKMKNFMLFDEADIDWSKNINIICGENSTGKTTVLKLMYSLIKPISKTGKRQLTKESAEQIFVEKLQGVFRPDEMKIGRLVSRKQGSNHTDFELELEREQRVSMGFGNRQGNHADLAMRLSDTDKKFDVVYIPTKEMISTTEHFASLYEEYHIDFEEMYYDLAKLLDKPLARGANTTEQNTILNSFESIMKGQIVQRDGKFYLRVKGEGEFEMGLLSDGYRKLSMLLYLTLSGSLKKDTILFWDEPETNMNPKMIRPIVQALIELAKMGVQIFVTTHDYFVQQEFNFLAEYPENNKEKLDIRFMSLYRDKTTNELKYEMEKSLADLEHNAVMEEFDALYDREQRIIYDN